MVQLKSYYSLCGIVDTGTVIGVEDDTARGIGLITLAKNVLARYRFSDQKQLNGWTSVDHLTSPVVYDTENQNYVGVFNENTIKMWGEDVTNLDNLKKYKFSKNICRLLRDRDGKCSVVFNDGFCASLQFAKHHRKNLETLSIFNKNESIIQCQLFSMSDDAYICYILKQSSEFSILKCKLNTDINTPVIEHMTRLNLKRNELPDGAIMGITISFDAKPPQVHVLWSDGRLFSISLENFNSVPIGHVPRICSEINVSMIWIGDNNIAIYGADSSRERAILVIYNTLFGVLSCSHPLKMFCQGAKLWCLTDFLILEATHHLAVVPYVLSSEQNALSLIGSHKEEDESAGIRMIDWGEGKPDIKPNTKYSELLLKGYSERDICIHYFPTLFDAANFTELKRAIDSFTDIPENLMIDILNKIIDNFDAKLCLSDSDKLIEIYNENSQICSILHSVLKLHFTREIMIPNLRTNLPFDNALFLLKYFTFLLSDSSDLTTFSVEFEQQIIFWAVTVLDAHFQQLLLSSEANVKNVTCNLIATIDNLIDNLDAVEAFIPVLNSVRNKRDDIDSADVSDSSYYIEEIKIKM